VSLVASIDRFAQKRLFVAVHGVRGAAAAVAATTATATTEVAAALLAALRAALLATLLATLLVRVGVRAGRALDRRSRPPQARADLIGEGVTKLFEPCCEWVRAERGVGR
jgi:NhaP-type Na+/H+ or K+/H+ antiporter